MLEVQTFLTSNTLRDLEEKHGVYARQSTLNPKKWCFTYDKDAVAGDVIADQCRGLILELDFDDAGYAYYSRVLALPFYRFYNHGQPTAHKIDWSRAVIFNKLDGSLCTVYFDLTLNSWCVSTRSVADADMPVDSSTITFRQLFERAVFDTYNLEFDAWAEKFLEKTNCYMFELTTPENKVVVNYDLYRIHLLTIREVASLREFSLPHGVWLTAKSMPVKNNEAAVLAALSELRGEDNEGFVVYDGVGRVKYKNPEWLTLSRLKDKSCNSPRALLGVLLDGRDDDVYPLLNERQKELVAKLKIAYQKHSKKNDHDWDTLKHVEVRKDLAREINKQELNMSYLMSRYAKKHNSYQEYVAHQKINDVWPSTFLDNMLYALNKY